MDNSFSICFIQSYTSPAKCQFSRRPLEKCRLDHIQCIASFTQIFVTPIKYKQRKLTFFAAFSVQQTTGTTATEEQDKKNDYHGNSDAKR